MMRHLALVLALLLASPLWAVEPHEMLEDPLLEARAQALDAHIRCVKCQSENIASSNAAWAADARVILRELLQNGASDGEVLDFFVARYGDPVLMKPRSDGSNLILWLAGPLMLVLAGFVGWRAIRPRPRQALDPLDPEEEARLQALLKD